jgi:hypothetical protein
MGTTLPGLSLSVPYSVNYVLPLYYIPFYIVIFYFLIICLFFAGEASKAPGQPPPQQQASGVVGAVLGAVLGSGVSSVLGIGYRV